MSIPAIPHPRQDIESLHRTVTALKEAVEALANVRGKPADSAITWQQLINLGIVQSSQVPTK
jgi:hypothetical protein